MPYSGLITFFKKNKKYLLIICYSVAFQVVLSLVRYTWGTKTGSVIGYFFYYFLFFYFVRHKKYTNPKICFSILAGILILQLPIRITSFESSSVTFIEFIFHLLGAPCAWLILTLKKKKTRIIVTVVSIPIILFCSIFFNKIWSYKIDYGIFSGVIHKNEVPDISGRDIHGDKISTKSYKNKLVLLDFWHTECSACFKRFPTLQLISDKYRKDTTVVIIAVNTPLKKDSVTQAFDMMRERKYTFKTIVLQNNQTTSKIGVKYYPTTVILDTEGNLIFTEDIEDAANLLEKMKK